MPADEAGGIDVKPALFEYCAASSVEDACARLAGTPGAMVLAGGQSLIPAMNFRLAAPPMLVDISRIAVLREIEVKDGAVTVGAAVRHRELERHGEATRAIPLIAQALEHVAHVPIRNRGTTVGSICHADAAAEMPLVLLLTGGHVRAASTEGSRDIPADAFFEFHMTTSRRPEELVTHAHFPALPEGARTAFAEFARRKGDYALAAVGAVIVTAPDGRIAEARLGACGIGTRPVRLTAAEAVLQGKAPSPALFAEAAAATADAVTAPDDSQASTAYRRHLLAGLTARVLAQATGASEEVPA